MSISSIPLNEIRGELIASPDRWKSWNEVCRAFNVPLNRKHVTMIIEDPDPLKRLRFGYRCSELVSEATERGLYIEPGRGRCLKKHMSPTCREAAIQKEVSMCGQYKSTEEPETTFHKPYFFKCGHMSRCDRCHREYADDIRTEVINAYITARQTGKYLKYADVHRDESRRHTRGRGKPNYRRYPFGHNMIALFFLSDNPDDGPGVVIDTISDVDSIDFMRISNREFDNRPSGELGEQVLLHSDSEGNEDGENLENNEDNEVDQDEFNNFNNERGGAVTSGEDSEEAEFNVESASEFHEANGDHESLELEKPAFPSISTSTEKPVLIDYPVFTPARGHELAFEALRRELMVPLYAEHDPRTAVEVWRIAHSIYDQAEQEAERRGIVLHRSTTPRKVYESKIHWPGRGKSSGTSESAGAGNRVAYSGVDQANGGGPPVGSGPSSTEGPTTPF